MSRRPRDVQRLSNHSRKVALTSEGALRRHIALTVELLEWKTPAEQVEGLEALLTVIRIHQSRTRDMVVEVCELIESIQRKARA